MKRYNPRRRHLLPPIITSSTSHKSRSLSVVVVVSMATVAAMSCLWARIISAMTCVCWWFIFARLFPLLIDDFSPSLPMCVSWGLFLVAPPLLL